MFILRIILVDSKLHDVLLSPNIFPFSPSLSSRQFCADGCVKSPRLNNIYIKLGSIFSKLGGYFLKPFLRLKILLQYIRMLSMAGILALKPIKSIPNKALRFNLQAQDCLN